MSHQMCYRVRPGRHRLRTAARPQGRRSTRVLVGSGTEPTEATPPDVAKARQQLRVLQWAVPALTGGFVVTAYVGEQQRPAPNVGVRERLLSSMEAPRARRRATGPAVISGKRVLHFPGCRARDRHAMSQAGLDAVEGALGFRHGSRSLG